MGAETAGNSSPEAGGAGCCSVAGSPWCNPQRITLLAAGLIVLATSATYCNSFTGPFVFDDLSSISSNTTIRQLWPLWLPLCPPNRGETVSGRPLLNLTLAIDFYVSRLDVWSYHATNLLIHILAALALFGILRRTFLLPSMRDRWGPAALPLALAIAMFVGGSSVADHVGNICHPAGRVAGRAVLSLDAVLLRL